MMTSTKKPAAILLDIEGTISSLPHVVNTFYPYTAAHIGEFLKAHRDEPEVRQAIEDTRALVPGAVPLETLLQWIAEDKKAAPLKYLQGRVWEHGYKEGLLHGHIYEDALSVLSRWHAEGIPLHIFSSGSVQCQVDFYQHSLKGDLRYLFTRHFDLSIGPKIDPVSYWQIAKALKLEPSSLLFFTDNPKEIEAATEAGIPAIQVLREGAAPDSRFPHIRSFHEVTFDTAP
jgi:enolase-phosphatase E1